MSAISLLAGVWEDGPRKGEPCPLQELPLNQLLVGQHFTPLGLRLARQLFLVYDQDQEAEGRRKAGRAQVLCASDSERPQRARGAVLTEASLACQPPRLG